MDPLDIKASADELTAKALPEIISAVNQALDRLESILDRLDGAQLLVKLAPKGK